MAPFRGFDCSPSFTLSALAKGAHPSGRTVFSAIGGEAVAEVDLALSKVAAFDLLKSTTNTFTIGVPKPKADTTNEGNNALVGGASAKTSRMNATTFFKGTF